MTYDFVIVGAGFAGSVCAERLASAGKRILLVECRDHIGGNAFDKIDEHGILIHPYGPHIFHTNSDKVFDYLSRFTEWRPYEHRVLSQVGGNLYPVPINRTTINRLYNLDLDAAGVEAYLDAVRDRDRAIVTSEDVVLKSVGVDLCDKFFRGYTHKQWDLDLSDLSPSVAARIPVRTNDDDRYFSDKHQCMPKDGYTKMFERMLAHENIDIKVATDFFAVRELFEFKSTIFTGRIDDFYNRRFGELPYRSLRFEHVHVDAPDQVQDVGTINYPNDFDYTRVTEFKHLTGQIHRGTSLVREYSTASGDPYYPIPRVENENLHKRYKALAEKEDSVYFVGRLAEYRYYNMDQVVGAALAFCDRYLDGRLAHPA